MTLVDGFAPPLLLQAMLVVRKTNETKNSLYHNQHCSVGEEEAQLYSHMGGLIIFVKDCRLNLKTMQTLNHTHRLRCSEAKAEDSWLFIPLLVN